MTCGSNFSVLQLDEEDLTGFLFELLIFDSLEVMVVCFKVREGEKRSINTTCSENIILFKIPDFCKKLSRSVQTSNHTLPEFTPNTDFGSKYMHDKLIRKHVESKFLFYKKT